jgi:hypothetical protein
VGAFTFLPFSASETQGGAGSPPPLVEVNQAIFAWSDKKKISAEFFFLHFFIYQNPGSGS